MIVAACVALAVTGIGVGLSLWIPVRLRLEERIALGVVLGVATVTPLSFLYFVLAGMGPLTMLFALVVSGSFALPGVVRHGDRLAVEARRARTRLAAPSRSSVSLRPFLAFQAAAVAVTTRILALAYQDVDGAVASGHLSTWGDWAAHLSYASSFAYGDNRGLELPLAAGAPLRYHFFANYLGALFTTTGLEVTRALVLTSWMLAVALPILLWCVVERLVRSRAVAALTIVLFTLTGGVGGWYLVGDVRDGGWDTLTALPRMYARIPERDLWIDNTISASLYAQRSTLLGLTFGVGALLILLAGRPRGSRPAFAAAGMIVGLTGIGFVHMLVTALALGAIAAWTDRDRIWLWFLMPAAAIGIPMMLAISPERSSIRWHVGFMATASDRPWIVWWLLNTSLLIPLFLGAVVFGGVPSRVRRLTMPLWLWFVVPNLIAFHPWDWNNTKFFLFWQLAGSLVVACLLVAAVERVRDRSVGLRIAAATVVAAAVVSLAATGAIDTVRAMQRSSRIPWVEQDDVTAAHWLRDNARPHARLVYGATNTSAVAALSGVPAVSGYPGWTSDLGMSDWFERSNASAEILRGGPDAAALIGKYGVDYVVIGPRERAEYEASDRYWEQHGTLVFAEGQYRIYLV